MSEPKPTHAVIRRTETRIETHNPDLAARLRRDPPRKLNIAEAACYLGISPKKLRNMVQDRTVHCTRLGGRIIFDRDKLETDLARLTVTAI